MRENRPSGSEGGVMQSNASSLPLLIAWAASESDEQGPGEDHRKSKLCKSGTNGVAPTGLRKLSP